jgi:branched-chain amino acid transport system ATP-binding protein
VTALRIEGLRKRFKGVEALGGVSFEVADGEVVGIVGANGAGKTTLFNTLSGIIPPDTGSIRLHGQEIAGLAPHIICKLGIGRAFQITRPFLNLTCLENVTIGALNRVPSAARARERAMTVLAQVGLDDKAEMLGRDLSVSWRKRLELARALASGPKVLLLDEVLAGLNELEINEMVRLLPTLTTNMTVLIIEHVIQAVLQLCRRAVFMQAGAVLVDGAPNAVMNDPVVIDSYLGTEREC